MAHPTQPQNFFVEEVSLQKQPRKYRWWFVGLIFFIFLLAVSAWTMLTPPPRDFPTQTIITIPTGATLTDIARLLGEKRIVRSPIAFVFFVRYEDAESRIRAGEYLFLTPTDLFGVAKRLISGVHGVERLRVTIPEGTSILGMKKIFSATFSEFSPGEFDLLTSQREGYLFPDTYFFFSNATSGPIVETLSNNFVSKTEVLHNDAVANKKSWSDTIIMASLIEEEAATPEDRRIVSGILWKRLLKGMRLQVDAPFAYAIGKNSATLTTDDLMIDSPYNTYRYDGLPPTPITNPGLDAITAALYPQTSPYYFYLSDKSGVMHYAKTFEEHKLNKERYLR